MVVRRTVSEAQATRQHVLSAAVEVFGTRGYPSATLDEIATRAGVTRGAVYHHFGGKAELYDVVLRDEADSVLRPLMAGLMDGGAPLERLREFLLAYGRALENDPRFRAILEVLIIGVVGAPPSARARTAEGFRSWMAAFRTLLQEAYRLGELRPGVSAGAATHTFVALATGLTTIAIRSPDLLSPSREAARLFDMFERGVAKP